MKHELEGATLTRAISGIEAKCVCGWSSSGHFSSFAASAAFMDHQEEMEKKEKAAK